MNGRVYDPEIGRFMSVDPVFQFPENLQSLNPYSYVGNNPLGLTDPSGLCTAATGTRIKSCVTITAVNEDGSRKALTRVNTRNPADMQRARSMPIPGVNNGAANRDNKARAPTPGNKPGNSQSPKVRPQTTTYASPSTTPGDKFIDNNEEHPPVAGDELFDSMDPTFHHFDVVSKPVCDTSEAGCTVERVQDELLPLFSRPTLNVRPEPADLSGKPVEVFGPEFSELWQDDLLKPNEIDNGDNYVTQARLPSGAIQNSTTSNHYFNPGKITRWAEVRNGKVVIVTHGVGVNRYSSSATINKELAESNDKHGPRLFRALDESARRYWREHLVQK